MGLILNASKGNYSHFSNGDAIWHPPSSSGNKVLVWYIQRDISCLYMFSKTFHNIVEVLNMSPGLLLKEPIMRGGP